MYGVNHVICSCGHDVQDGDVMYFIDGQSYCDECIDEIIKQQWEDKDRNEKLELVDGYVRSVTGLLNAMEG